MTKMSVIYLVSFATVLIIWMLLALSISRKAVNETKMNEIKEIGGKIFYNSMPSTATSMSNVILSEDLKKDD